jgi:glycosyltransferase involved in cell wall biosynthesis
MQKIKILHIIKSLGRGGAEMLLPTTLRLHDQDKYEFHYIYFLPWKDQMVKEIEEAGGKVTCIEANNNIELLMRYRKVIDYCRQHDISLIHCHLPWSAFLGRIVYKKTGLPMIYTEHNIQEKMHVVTKMLNKFSFNAQTMAIGVSKDATESIERNIAPKIPVNTVLNGVNSNHFKRDTEKGNKIREQFNIPLNAVVLGNIAVFREQKNLPNWVRAFAKIIEEHQNVYGILVGAGPTEEEVRKLITENGLSNRIIMPGLQTDTIPYFSAIDIYMLSSDFEGLPIALLEAMSMNCAIVSTKAGGVVEAVRDRKDGLLTETGNWQGLAIVAGSLIEDPEKLEKYQHASRKRVKEAFSLKLMVDQLEDIYKKTLQV